MAILDRERTTVTGVARNVTWRESQAVPVLTFRIEQVDEVGNVTGYVSVRSTSTEIKDVVTDGDEVEVIGTLTENGILELEELANRTTGATFTPSSNRLLGWLALVFFGVVIGAMIGSFVAPFSGGPAVGALVGSVVVLVMGLAYVLRKRSRDTVPGVEDIVERGNERAPPEDDDGEGKSEDRTTRDRAQVTITAKGEGFDGALLLGLPVVVGFFVAVIVYVKFAVIPAGAGVAGLIVAGILRTLVTRGPAW